MAGGAIQRAVQNRQMQPGAQPKPQSISQQINSYLDSEGLRKRFDELLGKRAPQFVSALVSLVNADTNLQQAMAEAPRTVVQAALKAATFDLPIDQNLGYAYIVPFGNKKKLPDGSSRKVKEATFILGWKGMHQLALRTGCYKAINVVDVREGELAGFNRLSEEIQLHFVEDEAEREKLPVIGYVGYYRLVNGFEKTVYMTKGQIEAHERRFRKGEYMGKGWRDDWDAMARKTVYRQLIGKWGVMSIDYQESKAGAMLAEQIESEYRPTPEEYEDLTGTPEDGNVPSNVDPETGEVGGDGEG